MSDRPADLEFVPNDDPDWDPDFDADRIVGCEYWRCGELFEARSTNHRFCRKACRSRQHKWERAQERKARKQRRAAERRGEC